MNPAAAWIQSSSAKREIDMSWMIPQGGAVRPMFVQEKAPELPKAPPQPAVKAPPAAPPGPSPEQLKRIAESEELIRLLSGSLEFLADATRKEISKTAAEIWEIALTVAEELAAGAIEVDAGRAAALIQSALEMVGADQDVKVHLHPLVFERLKTEGLLDSLKHRGGLNLIPDPKITDTGCIVESPLGRVDTRVRSRLNQLRHLFAERTGTGQ